jgi:tetratricopeptide (TPR) repeat protein
MSPSGCDQAWPRSILAPLLLAFLVAGGCSRVPRIIVLSDPLTAAEHVELGVAYERKGELDLARREYERALLKDGKFHRARVNLGNIFLAKKEYGKAREEYLAALELQPGDAEATNNLSWAAIFSGEGIDEALARMESVVSGPAPPVSPAAGVPQQREARTGAGRQPIFLDTLGVLRMRANRPGPAEEAFALADALCRQAGVTPREGLNGDAPCPEEVLREIEDHRGELRRRFPSTSPAPAN